MDIHHHSSSCKHWLISLLQILLKQLSRLMTSSKPEKMKQGRHHKMHGCITHVHMRTHACTHTHTHAYTHTHKHTYPCIKYIQYCNTNTHAHTYLCGAREVLESLNYNKLSSELCNWITYRVYITPARVQVGHLNKI